MAQQTINIGASPNDGTGTPLRTAFQYTNSNFSELYTAVGPSGNNIVVPGNATITGDLTVRTTGLTVNSSGVGVGVTAALGAGNIQIGAGKYLGYSATAYITPEDNVQGARIKANQVLIDATDAKFNIGGSEAMRLNSTGLGVGVASPVTRLQANKAGQTPGGVSGPNGALVISDTSNTSVVLELGTNSAAIPYIQSRHISSYGFYDLVLQPTSGNVGIGVTPSAWVSGSPAVQLKYNSSIWAFTDNSIQVNQNAFYDGAWKYINAASLEATNYYQNAGKHIWRNAVAGTAGNAITWTQAMTLDASGRLLVGTVTSGTSSGDGIVKLGTYGHCISQTGTSIASGSSVDLTVVTSGVGYQGFLSVANTLDANANARTQTTFSVFGRGASSTITQIATANGPTSGAAFTVTTPSNGVIRITNTSGNIATISAQFFGGASA